VPDQPTERKNITMCGNHQHDASDTATKTAPAAETEVSSSCCGGHTAVAPAAASAADAAECPVMPGSMVNKADAEASGLYRDYNGQRYWFCCAACGPMWDADPDKYAAA
jgi:YHS domain-containing protein